MTKNTNARRVTLVIASCMFLFVGVASHNLQLDAVTAGVLCNCGNRDCKSNCRKSRCKCRKSRCTCSRKCPKCQNDFCQLEMKCDKEQRTCYKTEQKIICIPTVRLPWQKCQPMCSKTRVINVLKKHKFECPKCKYTWSLYEPEIQQPGEAFDQPVYPGEGYEFQQMRDPAHQNNGTPREAVPYEQPGFEQETFDPAGSVPSPPDSKR